MKRDSVERVTPTAEQHFDSCIRDIVATELIFVFVRRRALGGKRQGRGMQSSQVCEKVVFGISAFVSVEHFGFPYECTPCEPLLCAFEHVMLVLVG